MQKHHLITVWAIVLGLAVSAGLSFGADRVLELYGILPSGSLMVSPLLVFGVLVYRSIFNFLGSFVAAYFAPSHPMLHALVLGLIGIIVRFFGLAASAKMNSSPAWYVWALFLIAMPMALWGGDLAARLRTKVSTENPQ